MSERCRVYVGTHEGLLVLDVNGTGSQLVNEWFSGSIVDRVAVCNGSPRAFAGVSHDGVYRSEDGGKQWHQVLQGDIRSLAIDPTNERVIYAGTEPVHLYRSEDAGDSWEEIVSLQQLPQETLEKLGRGGATQTVDPSNPQFQHLPQQWTFPLPPHEGHITQIFVHPADPNLILLSIEHGGVALSRDRGKSWEDASQGIEYLDIHTVLGAPSRLGRFFVASARGFYTTADPATGWTRAEDGCTRSYFHDFIFLPAARRY